MTDAEKAAKAFVDAPCTPKQMEYGYRIEYEAFLAGAAWQREQDAKLVAELSRPISYDRLAEMIRAQHANQDKQS